MARYCTIPEIFGLREWYEKRFGDLCKAHDESYVIRHISRWQADWELFMGMVDRGYPVFGFLTWLFARTVGWFYWIT